MGTEWPIVKQCECLLIYMLAKKFVEGTGTGLLMCDG